VGQRARPALSHRTLVRFLLYGLVAALHFLLYIASLSYTTIAHSLALVYTAPVFVTLFAALFLGERLRPRQWLGIPVVVAGIGVLAGFEPRMDPQMAFGDALAIGSAVCFGLYSVAGRRERASSSLYQYASLVYLAAALWLAPAAALGGTGAVTWTALGAVAFLGLFPLAIGHTLYNASLRRVHPTYVNLVATQEVTGGVLLGYLLLGEAPGPEALVGAGLSLLGVALVLLL
jgi:drug/metabolite transporter (DMT)-like permease